MEFSSDWGQSADKVGLYTHPAGGVGPTFPVEGRGLYIA